VRSPLDTHVWPWLLAAGRRVPDRVRDDVAEAESLALSAVSVRETVVRVGLGRLDPPLPLRELVAVSPGDSGMTSLAVEPRHVLAVGELPGCTRTPPTGWSPRPGSGG